MKKYKWENDPIFDDDIYSSERLMSQMNAIIERDYTIWNHATEQAIKYEEKAKYGKEKF